MAWPAFTWDATARQYRRADGRFVPRRQVRQALDEAIDRAREDLAATTRLLQAGALDIGSWQLRVEAGLKAIHVMSAAVAAGGWAQATAADWSMAANRIKAAYVQVETLARRLEAGVYALDDGRLVPWVAGLGAWGSGTYETALRKRDLTTGRVVAERRLIHSGQPCFVAGTMIDTDRGSMPIELIRAGDRVLTRAGYRAVLRTMRTPYRRHLVRVKAGDRSVVCTPEHPFLTQRGWVAAESLGMRDHVVLREDTADQAGIHVAFPDANNGVSAGPEVGITGDITFLLSPLTLVERLESGVAVPPIAVGLDDKSADANIDQEMRLDDDLGFVGDADLVEDGPKAFFEAGRFVSLDSGTGRCHCGDDFRPAADLQPLCPEPLRGAGATRRIVSTHPPAVDLDGDLRDDFGRNPHPELTRPVIDRGLGLPGSRRDARRSLDGIEPADDLVFLGAVAVEGPGHQGAVHASLGIVQLRPSAGRAYRRLFRRIQSEVASFAEWLGSLSCVATFRTSDLPRPRLSRSGSASAAKRLNSLPEVPATRAGVPNATVNDPPGRDSHDDSSVLPSKDDLSVLYGNQVDVFNLEVDGLPEYVANGFVVHNCKPCLAYHAAGWQPPGVLPDIGTECLCKKFCRCTFQRRMAKAKAKRRPPAGPFGGLGGAGPAPAPMAAKPL